MVGLQTVAVAFSMFSRIPMPQFAWDSRNMRYALCAFPLIGAVIWGAVALWLYLCELLALPDLLRAAVATVIPVWITGGIHLDGYADTQDALASFSSPFLSKRIRPESASIRTAERAYSVSGP